MPHSLPWYVAGPLIGLMVPALLLLGNKAFGVSSNLRHLCAALGSWAFQLLTGLTLCFLLRSIRASK